MGTATSGSCDSTTAAAPAHARCTSAPGGPQRIMAQTEEEEEETSVHADKKKTGKPSDGSCWWVECVRAGLEGFPRGGRV